LTVILACATVVPACAMVVLAGMGIAAAKTTPMTTIFRLKSRVTERFAAECLLSVHCSQNES
jgi:hypothetical protein